MKPSLFIALILGVSALAVQADEAVKSAEAATVAAKKPELPPGWTVPVKSQPSGAKEILAQVEVKPENRNRRLEYLQEMQRRIDNEKALLVAQREAQLRAMEIQAQEDAAFQARVDARISQQARAAEDQKHRERMEELEEEKLRVLRSIDTELTWRRLQGR